MSPRGGPSRRRGASPRRGGRTALKVVVALLLLVGGAAVGAVAVIFGLVPGFRVRSPFERLPDSTLVAVPDSLPAAVAPDLEAVPLPPLDAAAPIATTAGAVTAADSADGERVYRNEGRCLSCHGEIGEGVGGLGPDLRDGVWLVGDGSVESIARTVAEGVSPPRSFPIAMPAYAGQLSPDAIRRVAAYVHAISHPGAVAPDSGTAAGDSLRLPDPSR